MHGDDCFGFAADEPSALLGVDVGGLSVHVAKHHRRTRVGGRFRRGKETDGGHDDFVAVTHAERLQRNRDGIRAVPHADAVAGRAVLGKALLELLHARTADEVISAKHGSDRLIELRSRLRDAGVRDRHPGSIGGSFWTWRASRRQAQSS